MVVQSAMAFSKVFVANSSGEFLNNHLEFNTKTNFDQNRLVIQFLFHLSAYDSNKIFCEKYNRFHIRNPIKKLQIYCKAVLLLIPI